MIAKFRHQQFQAQNHPTLILDAYEIPFGIQPDHPWRHDCDDRSIGLPHDHGSIWIFVFDPPRKVPIANAVFALTANAVTCDGVDVDQLRRGNGIACDVYALAKFIANLPLAPSMIQTPDAIRLWSRLLATGMAP